MQIALSTEEVNFQVPGQRSIARLKQNVLASKLIEFALCTEVLPNVRFNRKL